MLSRLSTLSLVAIATISGNAAAQIPNRNPNAPRPNAPLLLVATPYTPIAEDSAAAVEAGVGLRERLRRLLGRDYNITTREKMNEQLVNFGYPVDALLDQHGAGRFASSGSASLLVYPTYQRINNGHVLNARLRMVGALTGIAGHVVSVTANPGEKSEDLGERAAEQLRPAFRAMASVRECFNSAATDQAKAIAAAQKALSELPGLGAAEFCWGEILRSRDTTSTEALAHFERAVQSDPMSLGTYEKMGSIYHLRGDSAKVITTYQTMLQVDPLDQALRERSFQLFQIYGRPSAAEEVADAGIQRDPSNTDWYDLKSNACLMQEKYSCAIDELEKLWTVDSTRADSSFFSKITYATLGGSDTARFVKWAVKGVERYPDHQDILIAANRAYGISGDVDNALATTRKLMVINQYDTDPIRRTAALLGAAQIEKMFEFLPAVRDAQDEALTTTFGNLLVNAASVARTAGDTARQLAMADTALTLGMTDPLLLSYAGFFSAEPRYQRITAMQAGVRESRSCQRVAEYEPIVTSALSGFKLAQGSTDEAIKTFANRLVPFLETELQAVAQMKTTFRC